MTIIKTETFDEYGRITKTQRQIVDDECSTPAISSSKSKYKKKATFYFSKSLQLMVDNISEPIISTVETPPPNITKRESKFFGK